MCSYSMPFHLITDCMENHNEVQGYITSPNYPSSYGYNTDCLYLIEPPGQNGPYLLTIDEQSIPYGLSSHYIEVNYVKEYVTF